jgi:hypothetical protein
MAPIEIAESFHLAFLQALATRANLSAWALKGGGNLRYFTKTLRTPVGTYSVHRLPPELFGGYEERDGERVATAEKAVFDTLYLARARGKRFSHLTEVDLPAGFRAEVLSDWATKIQDPRVRSFVQARITDFLEHARR